MRKNDIEFRLAVYGRRDEKVKKQKNVRTALFSLIIPLILCASAFALSPALQMKSADQMGLAESENRLEENTIFDMAEAESTSFDIQIHENQNVSYPENAEEKEAILSILNQYHSLFTDDDTKLQSQSLPEGARKIIIAIGIREYTLVKSEDMTLFLVGGKQENISNEDFETLWNLVAN